MPSQLPIASDNLITAQLHSAVVQIAAGSLIEAGAYILQHSRSTAGQYSPNRLADLLLSLQHTSDPVTTIHDAPHFHHRWL